MIARDFYGGISEVRKASRHRFDDAQAAYSAARWRACMYLAGYAVECRLKASLMKTYGCVNLKELVDVLTDRGMVAGANELYTHSLEKLLALTGRASALLNNPVTVRQFVVINRWTPAWRYTADLSNPDAAEQFLEATRGILHWVDVNV